MDVNSLINTSFIKGRLKNSKFYTFYLIFIVKIYGDQWYVLLAIKFMIKFDKLHDHF